MPYNSEKIRIAGTEFDRRKKFTDDQKAEVVSRWKGGESKHSLSREFGVSRATITIWTDPERAERRRRYSIEYSKANRMTGKEWAEQQKSHRRYKQKLKLEGKIK